MNMSRFPNCMISGMSSEEITDVLDLHELEDAVSDNTNFFFSEPADEELDALFDIVPNNEITAITDLEEEVSTMEKSMATVSTARQEKLHIKMLEDFVQKSAILLSKLILCLAMSVT